MTALFGKKKKDDDVKIASHIEEKVSDTPVDIKGNWSFGGQQVLKEFYVSEKAPRLHGMNQYTFIVFNSTNGSEVKKQVERVFDVKVRDVKVLNMPRKNRNIGQHPGFKSGFKKAIVVLEKGYSIEQAKS